MHNCKADLEIICAGDPQAALRKALKHHNISLFRRALKDGADADFYDDINDDNVFEIALKTPGTSIFIDECIKFSVDIDNENPQTSKYPIHYAIESEDVENLRALLKVKNIDLNAFYEERTAIFLLIERLNEHNFNQIFDCIQLLITYGADLAILNSEDETAIDVLMKLDLCDERKRLILDFCVNCIPDLEIQTLIQNCITKINEPTTPVTPMPIPTFYNLTPMAASLPIPSMSNLTPMAASLPIPSMSNLTPMAASLPMPSMASLNPMTEMLRSGSCQDILESNKLKQFDRSYSQVSYDNLLQNNHILKVALEKGHLKKVEKIIEATEDFKESMLRGLLAIACCYGYYEILYFLMGKMTCEKYINEDPLLCIVVKKLKHNSFNSGKRSYSKCLKILLNDPRVDVDKTDKIGCSALYYAVKYKVDDATELLLKASAYIGIKNVYDDIAIGGINPKIFEKYLDSCLIPNNQPLGDDDFGITIKFSCLEPPIRKCKFERVSYKNDDEMTPITYISKSNDLEHLLKHPVISSFIFVKWLRLSVFFYLNLALCTLLFLAFAYYVLGFYGRDDVNQTMKNILWIVQFFGTTFIFLRELSQFLLTPKIYFISLENIMEIILISLLYTSLFNENFTESGRKILISIIILLAAFEFTLLVGSLPFLSISTHMMMLKTVSRNFFKSLILYSIILIAFALSFHTLFSQPKQSRKLNGVDENNNTNSTESSNDEDDDEQFNTFGSVGNAVLKTLVMLTGEFEAANIRFNVNSVSYIIFILFIFFVSIVLFNLINGLAVSDTQAIKSEAEIIGLSEKVRVLTRFEKSIHGSDPKNFGGKLVQKILPQNFMKLFPSYLPLNGIIIYPNVSNKIMIPIKDTKEDDDLSESAHLLAPGEDCKDEELADNFITKFHRMDPKIVRFAKETVYNRMLKQNREMEFSDMKARLKNIENNMKNILDILLRMSSNKNRQSFV